jgi:hypothetical protein
MSVYPILVFLTIGYRALEDDDKRKAVWLTHVPLGKRHELRAKINNGKTPDAEVLKEYDATVIAAVLKLYLLELPGMVFLLAS